MGGGDEGGGANARLRGLWVLRHQRFIFER